METITINSLAPERSGCNFENVVFKLALLICIFKSSYDNVARWIPQELTDNKSTLVQVMAWCRQATSHYLSQCWPRSMSPYGITRPQWVKYVINKSNHDKQHNNHNYSLTFQLLLIWHYLIVVSLYWSAHLKNWHVFFLPCEHAKKRRPLLGPCFITVRMAHFLPCPSQMGNESSAHWKKC